MLCGLLVGLFVLWLKKKSIGVFQITISITRIITNKMGIEEVSCATFRSFKSTQMNSFVSSSVSQRGADTLRADTTDR